MVTESAQRVLRLYKQFLSTASKFDNYNFREYAKRKVRYTFKENKDIADPAKVDRLYDAARTELTSMARQATISQMYRSDKLVVERLRSRR